MTKCNVANRTIFCKDNLDILRAINNECIDLIYLDPPFNKNKVFAAPIGSSAEGAEFKDIFRESDLKDEWVESIKEDNHNIHNLLQGIKSFNKRNNYNYCYMVYMAIRLLEMHRILKPTGSLYLHCDPTMSHYLKLLMDCIFDENNFRNEIIWCYTGPGSPHMRQFNRKSDSIFWYSKGDKWIFNKDDIRVPFKDPNQTLRRAMSTTQSFTKEDVEKYREKGKVPENWWPMRIAARSKKEYCGYPTQKPIALLERIIMASSNEGDIVLDPFCGCATTCVAAEKLKRQWIGTDISVKAYDLVKQRLGDEVYFAAELWNADNSITYRTDPPIRTDIGYSPLEKKFVYIISNKSYPDNYKVGIAKDPLQRLNHYQTADPDRGYNIEYLMETPDFRELEKHIHRNFDNKLEWVSADISDIKKEMQNFVINKGYTIKSINKQKDQAEE
ncbi:MAG: hypothetical protein HAW67_04320 [Endozoicomonadaceae bacterium]|nr:hypothetical protein [Endozoicomonadaceae bacterium]